VKCRFRREGSELSEEPVAGGGTPTPAAPDAGPDAPPIPGEPTLDAARPAALAADPLHVAEDADPVPTRPVVLRLDDIARSLDPSVCPFLRRDLHGTLVAPASVPGVEQTCIAVGAPRPQPLRQQELVCLRDAHADCPRYLRGATDASSPAKGAGPAIPKATIAALLILVLSAALSFAFVVQRGGIAMPAVGESPTAIAAVSTPTVPDSTAAPAVTEVPASVAVLPSASPTLSPAPSPTPPPSPSPSPTLSPTPPPTPSPTPTPARTASPKPSATPTSTRYKVLKACPNRTKCYIYRVRSGDNLFSIANYFGHSLATIYRWNPQYPGTRLRVGDSIRMPPPTR
jgi:LysM repeat protein